MKKLVLFFIAIAAATYTRAQTAPLSPNAITTYEVKPWQPVTMDSVLKFKPGKKTVVTPSPVKNDDQVIFYSRMPVAKPAKGNSRMPVGDLNNINMRYTMPVARVHIVNPDTVGVEKVIP